MRGQDQRQGEESGGVAGANRRGKGRVRVGTQGQPDLFLRVRKSAVVGGVEVRVIGKRGGGGTGGEVNGAAEGRR